MGPENEEPAMTDKAENQELVLALSQVIAKSMEKLEVRLTETLTQSQCFDDEFEDYEDEETSEETFEPPNKRSRTSGFRGITEFVARYSKVPRNKHCS